MGMALETPQYHNVILFWTPTHDDIRKWYLFHAISLSDDCVNGPQLLEGFADTLEGGFQVPLLCPGQHQWREEEEMSTVLDADVILQEVSWHSIFLYLKVQYCRVGRVSALMRLVSLVDQCLTGELGKGLSMGVTWEVVEKSLIHIRWCRLEGMSTDSLAICERAFATGRVAA